MMPLVSWSSNSTATAINGMRRGAASHQDGSLNDKGRNGNPSEFHFREVFEALRNLVHHGGGLVLDEIVLHAGLFGGGENGRPVHLSGADGHVVLHIGAAGEVAFHTLAQILYVH